jgi:hypothetical protein
LPAANLKQTLSPLCFVIGWGLLLSLVFLDLIISQAVTA